MSDPKQELPFLSPLRGAFVLGKALHRAIVPEFQVSVRLAMGDSLALFLQQILQSRLLVEEDTKVITHHMARLAARTLNKHCATVVTLLRHAMLRALAAWFAGESNFVGLFVFATLLIDALPLSFGFLLGRVLGERAARSGVLTV